jgi:hypothetical protein
MRPWRSRRASAARRGGLPGEGGDGEAGPDCIGPAAARMAAAAAAVGAKRRSMAAAMRERVSRPAGDEARLGGQARDI